MRARRAALGCPRWATLVSADLVAPVRASASVGGSPGGPGAEGPWPMPGALALGAPGPGRISSARGPGPLLGRLGEVAVPVCDWAEGEGEGDGGGETADDSVDACDTPAQIDRGRPGQRSEGDGDQARTWATLTTRP